MGSRTDLNNFYSLADLVISASTDPEAFGRISVEAQAMGKFVIASNHGGSVETVNDGKQATYLKIITLRIYAKKLLMQFLMKNINQKRLQKHAFHMLEKNIQKLKCVRRQ